MHLGAQLRPRSQTRERSDRCLRAHRDAGLLAIDVGHGLNHGACLDAGIGNHAVGANAHAVAQADMPFKHAVHIDFNIGTASQRAAHVQAGGVGQAHALGHQGLGLSQLVSALQSGELHRAVDAIHLHTVVDHMGGHGLTIGHGEFHDVGQVVLLLGVVVVQARQPGLEQAGGHGHDAAVNFVNRALGLAGIFVLHNGPHLALGIAHDAAITRGVRHGQRQQCQALARTLRDQGLQGLWPGQGHIARQDHGDAVIRQHRHRLLHRMAGAQLRHLAHKLQARLPRQSRLDRLCAMPRDGHNAAGRQTLRGVNDMLHQSPAPNTVQDFGHTALHAGAFARSHDHHIDCCHVFVPHLEKDYRRALRPCPAQLARPARPGPAVQPGRVQLCANGVQPKP